MEKETVKRCMLDILNVMDLPTCIVSTDRHVSIKKLMKTNERFQHMLYQFDPWYVGESILKKLWKLLRRKVIIFFILLANLLYLVVMP